MQQTKNFLLKKLKFLTDLCDANTLFLCFCETFLHDGIGDIEIQIPNFSITRCDRLSRVGGGVCIDEDTLSRD